MGKDDEDGGGDEGDDEEEGWGGEGHIRAGAAALLGCVGKSEGEDDEADDASGRSRSSLSEQCTAT